MGGGNAKGIFALIDYDWLNQDTLDTPVKWHCGDPEVDPWEWRMRVLEERTDIAYSLHSYTIKTLQIAIMEASVRQQNNRLGFILLPFSPSKDRTVMIRK